MKILKSTVDLEIIDHNKSLALVPTMGALHEGHLALIEAAKQNAEIVCVSIFVNPLQFSANEDLNKYPRTLEEDLDKLSKLKVDYVFIPKLEEIYPKESPIQIIKADPLLANCLCGLSRPGHFDGVCTVVKRLVDLIKPKILILGEKDFQQLMIIKEMVSRFNLNIKIIPVEIIRDITGLALSSRNQYLNLQELSLATNIFKTLCSIRADHFSIEEGIVILNNMGIKVEYLEIKWGRLLFAGKVNNTRLIDNIALIKAV
jgi:pantoate--beta-alanine ligase